MENRKILVLGATGTVGSSLVQQLSERGERVRAATRDVRQVPSLQGVEAVVVSYNDPSSVESALEGVESVFVLTPWGVAASVPFIEALLNICLPRVRHVVTMVGNAAELNPNSMARKVELLVESADVTWTHLRATWFMQNFHKYWFPMIDETGTVMLPAGNSKTAFIDARDIAACAAIALTSDKHVGQSLTLTGPEALGYEAAIAILGSETDQELAYKSVDADAFIARVVADGVPRQWAEGLSKLFESVRAGTAAKITEAVEEITGRPARSLRDYARDHASRLMRTKSA